EPELVDEMDTRLDAVVAKGGTLAYVYDFGDWWQHHVLVEDVVTVDAADGYPTVTGGAHRCPPEDVGGPAGYADFRAAMAAPSHPRHTEMRDWYGRDFDPEAFDLGRAGTLTRRLT
ncbi:MAG TPA: plasmid pRiA4b ORF-3 family protein, partial [Actinoplanes sp.]|nr:plasmid pRiA4b ORF-3 family protein [Actinoplanes sp.]